jgi:hypothetical protein
MKVLYWDCETSPNLAHVWDLWNQNIGLNQLLESGDMLCFGAYWEDAPSTPIFHAVWHDSGEEGMVRALWELLNEADIVVTYNGKRFDTLWAQTKFADLSLSPPAPYRQIDLYAAVKAQFRFPSYKLEYVAKRLLGTGKVKHEGHDLWVKVMAGDQAARKRFERYCLKDAKLLIALKARILAWIPRIPSLAPLSATGEDSCPACDSTNLVRQGYASTQTRLYQRYKCRDCKKWSRATRCVPGSAVGITETPIN